jgi:hypothetical protein
MTPGGVRGAGAVYGFNVAVAIFAAVIVAREGQVGGAIGCIAIGCVFLYCLVIIRRYGRR